MVGVGSIIASAQYENAIAIEHESSSGDAFDLCAAICIGVCAIVSAGGFALSYCLDLAAFLSTAVNLISPLILLSSAGYVLSFWWNKHNRYGNSAAYQMTQSLTSSVFKVLLGLANIHRWGLIISSFAGQIAGIGSILAHDRKNRNPILRFRWKRMRVLARKHKAFPKFTLPHKLTNTLTVNMPIFIMSAAFDLKQVGFFSLALNVALKPIWAEARAMNQVLFQRVCQNEIEHKDSYWLLRRICRKLAVVFVPFVIIAWLILPRLSVILFGDAWHESGLIIQMCLTWMVCSFLSNSLNFVPSVYSKQKAAFYVEITGLVLNITALSVGAFLLNDVMLCVSILSMSNSIFCICQVCWYLSLSSHRQR